MEQQVTIFDELDRNVDDFFNSKYFHRTKDPETSRKAVNTLSIKGQCESILKAIKSLNKPFTASELSDFSGIDYYTIQKRLSVLERKDQIQRTGEVRDKKGVWELC